MESSPVLLHIAQTAVRVTTVDPDILAGAAASLTLAAIAIWLPRSRFSLGMLRHRCHRRRAAGAVATVLLFLALLPSVVPYDHLIARNTHAESEEAAPTHASHCHVNPGTCSDAPVTAG